MSDATPIIVSIRIRCRDGVQREFYPYPAHGVYYELGAPAGEVGTWYIPVLRSGRLDIQNMGECEVSHEEATGESRRRRRLIVSHVFPKPTLPPISEL